MSEATRELIPILFAYGCVGGLLLLIAGALRLAFDGDRFRAQIELDARYGASVIPISRSGASEPVESVDLPESEAA